MFLTMIFDKILFNFSICLLPSSRTCDSVVLKIKLFKLGGEFCSSTGDS